MTSSGDPSPSDLLLRDLARAPELSVEPRRLARGDRLGRFEILDEIGRGGFGVVYEARDSELGRRVAIKVLRGARDEQRLEWFRQEARAAARFAHPNLVTLHDHGTFEGRPYLVLERLHG